MFKVRSEHSVLKIVRVPGDGFESFRSWILFLLGHGPLEDKLTA